MSTRRSNRPQSNDRFGPALLALVGIAIIVVACTKGSDFAAFAMLLLGAALIMMSAFHSRIRGIKLSNKLEMPIAPDSNHETHEPRSIEQPPQIESRPRSLGEITEAAKNPETNRRRHR